MELFFWILIAILFYSYIGYGMLLWLLIKVRSRFKKPKRNEEQVAELPFLTLVVPSYNEEAAIGAKIENTLALDYPKEKLTFLFVTDGSSDRTTEIIASYNQFGLLHDDERKGKPAAMNRAMKYVTTPIVAFCDANTFLNQNALRELVKHYKNPEVGGVAGEKRIINVKNGNLAGAGEGFYWKYESFLKQLDSDFFTVVGAAGELFSFRTELFERIEEDTLLDDFVISLRICQKGYRVVYEKCAYAMEQPSLNIKEEQKRKVRISAGAFQSMIRLAGLFNFFRHPALSFQYISHRVLRWAVCPFIFPMLVFLNIILVQKQVHFIYVLTLALQAIFYLFAFCGWLLVKYNKKMRLLNFPYYFMFINLSLYAGLSRYLKGSQSVTWEKAKRKL